MTISIIAAMGKNREIGVQNNLPWNLPDDLARFKKLTSGHAVIMGWKTHESIGRPLPARKNIVISLYADSKVPGCIVVTSLEEAFRAAEGDDEVFIIGGAETYRFGLPYANKMYLTLVDAAIKADAFFPEFNESEWRVTPGEVHEADEKHAYRFTFKTYERK